MGYASTLLYGDNFQVGGALTSITITSAVGDKALGTITPPSDMVIKKVFLDLSIRSISSNSGGAFNWLVANAHLTATRSGTTTTAYTFPTNSLYVFGATVQPGAYIYGNVDVAARFSPGAATTISLDDADALGDSLALWDCQPVARIIMR